MITNVKTTQKIFTKIYENSLKLHQKFTKIHKKKNPQCHSNIGNLHDLSMNFHEKFTQNFANFHISQNFMKFHEHFCLGEIKNP